MTALSYPARLAQLARADGQSLAVRVVHPDGRASTLTRIELLTRARRAAHRLRHQGVGPDTTVVVSLPTCLDHVVATYAAWMLGSCVLPVSAGLKDVELKAIVTLVEPAYVVSEPFDRLDGWPDDELPDVVASPGRALCSGGSTGSPKVIVTPGPHCRRPGDAPGLLGAVGLAPTDRQLVGSGLFHNTPFTWSHLAIFEGQPVTYLERFDAAQFVDEVQRFRPTVLPLVPTMMMRIARVPDVAARAAEGWSGVRRVLHTGAPCPDWAKRAWCDLVGPEAVLEAYGGTDYIGATAIRGDEWLRHPGSVGRGADCDVRIGDEGGRPLPAGEVGLVWMRLHDGAAPPFRYRGAPELPLTEDGFRTLGDLGHLDDDGYLHLADRRTDLIITGGVNVYPAEVEAAISEHPDVVDVVVVGLPDEDWGRRVHAVVEVRGPVTLEELEMHADARLASYKRPKSLEIVSQLPRNEAGKLRRGAVLAARLRTSPG